MASREVCATVRRHTDRFAEEQIKKNEQRAVDEKAAHCRCTRTNNGETLLTHPPGGQLFRLRSWISDAAMTPVARLFQPEQL